MKRIITIIWKTLKGILNVCRKTGVVVMSCCAAYFVYAEFDDDINDPIHPWAYDYSLSPSLFVKYNARQKCFRLYDIRTGKPLTEAKSDNILMLNENLFRCVISGSTCELLYNANGQQIKN